MEMYLPSFRTMRKRSRSRSPTPCEHDRPLKRTFTLGFAAVGDGAHEPPPFFTSPQAMTMMTASSSPAQEQTLSALLVVPGSVTPSYIPATDANESIQDEWVNLTRNLTLLSSARAPAIEHDIIISSSREEVMMNLDEPPQSSNPLHSHAQGFRHQYGTEVQEPPGVNIDHAVSRLLNPDTADALTPCLPSSRVTPPAAVAFLRAPSPPMRPTPPLCPTPLPSHSPFSAAHMGNCNVPPFARREPEEPQQPHERLPGPTRRSRFTIGPRPDCNKCRLGVPGHYAHFD